MSLIDEITGQANGHVDRIHDSLGHVSHRLERIERLLRDQFQSDESELRWQYYTFALVGGAGSTVTENVGAGEEWWVETYSAVLDAAVAAAGGTLLMNLGPVAAPPYIEVANFTNGFRSTGNLQPSRFWIPEGGPISLSVLAAAPATSVTIGMLIRHQTHQRGLGTIDVLGH